MVEPELKKTLEILAAAQNSPGQERVRDPNPFRKSCTVQYTHIVDLNFMKWVHNKGCFLKIQSLLRMEFEH